MITSSTPAGLFNLGRVETGTESNGARDVSARGDAAVSFASLLVALLGGGAEANAELPMGPADAGEGTAPEGEEGGDGVEGGTSRSGSRTAVGSLAGAREAAAALTGTPPATTPAASAASAASAAPAETPPEAEGRTQPGPVSVDRGHATEGASAEDLTTRRFGGDVEGTSTVAVSRPESSREPSRRREPSRVEDPADPRAASAQPRPESVATAAAAAAPPVAPPASTPASMPTSAAAAASVRTPDRTMSHLDPEMREKVQRVIERMASEHGEDVVLLEGVRTPERQAWLYEQGRTRPGPVVTWTRSSMHSKGLAADLKVQDAGGETRPYAMLQQVATEEGLSVLGMKDPGHVELRTDGAEPGGETEPAPSTPARRSAPARVATARVATPAAPARVGAARAASVAQVARPAGVATRVAPTAHAATTAYAHAATSTPGAAPRVARKPAEGGREEPTVSGEQPRAMRFQGGVQEVAAPSVAAPAQPLERIERMVEAMEARDATLGPGARRVSVRLDGTAGPVERVQVQMLDRALRGSVSVDDAQLGQRLKDSTSELLRTLERGGYDARSIDVKNTAPTQGTHEVLGAATRNENVAEAVRTLFASDHGGGRDGQDGRTGRGHGGDPRRQDGLAHHSRRDNRRKER